MHFHKNVRLLLPILVTFLLIVGINGCKEGTNKTTVGQLIGVDGESLSALEKEGVIFYPVIGKLTTSATDQSLGNTPISIIQNGKVVANTNSTDDGSFFVKLPEGFYEFSAAPQHAFFASSSYFIRVQPEGTVSPEVIEIAINDRNDATQKRFSVAGKCVNANNPQESAGHILVELGLGQSPFKPNEVTQASALGEYSFKDILPGHYTLRLAYNSPVYNEELHKFEIDSSGKFSPPVNVLMVTPRDGEEIKHNIEGKVVNASNLLEPIPNVLVKLLLGPDTIRVQQTTSGGDFELTNVPAHKYTIRFTDPSKKFKDKSETIEVSNFGEVRPPVNISTLEKQDSTGEPPMFIISGRTMNSDNPLEPAAYIAVELSIDSNGVSSTFQISQTSSNGEFSFNNIPTGTYKIGFAKGSDFFQERTPYKIEVTKNGVINPPVNMILIEQKKEINRLHRIQGKAVDMNITSVPVANAVVELSQSGQIKHVSITSTNGDFSFDQVVPETYDLTIKASAKHQEHTVKDLKIDSNGVVSPPINLVLVPAKPLASTMDISGTLTDSNTGASITGAKVDLGSISAFTNTEGKFYFSNVSTGLHNLTFSKGGFQSNSLSFEILANSSNDALITRPSSLNHSLQKNPLHRIQGKAVDMNITSVPVANAVVELSQSGQIKHVGITSTNGDFSFDQVVPGDYSLSIKASGKYKNYLKDITIGGSGVVTPPINLVFIETTEASPSLAHMTVSGTLTDSYTGAPIEYASVNLKNYGNVLTDTSGQFLFTEVLKGNHELTFSKNGFESLTTAFEIVENDAKDALITRPSSVDHSLIYIQETNKGSIAGRIFDDYGNPLTDKVARLYVMRYVTQTKNIGTATETEIISEKGWRIDSSPIKTTRTSTISNGANNKGTFKFTHITPSSTDIKYIVYIGDGNNTLNTSTVPSSLYPTHFTWDVVSSGGVGHIVTWSNVGVNPNQTTYLSNYELSNP